MWFEDDPELGASIASQDVPEIAHSSAQLRNTQVITSAVLRAVASARLDPQEQDRRNRDEAHRKLFTHPGATTPRCSPSA